MKIKIADIIFFMACFYLFIDTINGITVRNYGFSISQIYKSIYLILIVFWLIRNRIHTPVYILLLFFLLIYLHLYNSENISYILMDIILANRFLLIVTSFYFFRTQIIRYPHKFVLIRRIFIINSIVFGVNILFGYLGFGYAQYESIGIRGWFYAGNDTSLVFLILSLFILSYFQIKGKLVYVTLFSLLTIFIGFLIITKTAIIGSILIILGIPLINLLFNRKRESIKQIILLSVVIAMLGSTMINFLLYQNQGILRYERFTKGSFTVNKLIAGGREDRKVIIFDSYRNPKISDIIIGRSFSGIKNSVSAEIDYIDIFIVFGLLGVVVTYGFFILILFGTIKQKILNRSSFSLYNIFGILLILVISTITGHVMTAGLSSILLGTYLALPYAENRYIKYSNINLG